jgi:tetratricopeptide (TPR) repeat protein
MAGDPTGTTPTQPAAGKRKTSPVNGGDDGLTQSFAAALKAVQASPESDEAWDHVEELADALQRPDDVAEAYRELLEGPLSPVLRGKLSQRAVQFHDEWFGDNPDAMAELLARIVERDAEAEWAFERLVVVLTVAERWDDLLALYDRVLDTTRDRARRKRLLDDAAHVAKDFADQAARAVDYMSLQLDLEPHNLKLAASIERLLERQERWKDLVDLWKSRLPELSPNDARDMRVKIAAAYVDRMAAPAAALEELTLLMEESPGHAGGCEQLERILALDGAPETERMAALSLLRTAYEAGNRGPDLVTALERAVAFSEPPDRLALHREAGARLAILGRDAEALDHYAALLQAEPSDADARRQLRQLARRSGLHEVHARALVDAAEQAEPGQRAALLLEAATITRTELADAERAAPLYGRVVDLSEAEPTLALQAAHQLNELLAAGAQAEQRIAVLERLADLEPSSIVRRAILGEVGKLASDLGDPDRALAAYERRLQDDPADLEALDASIAVLTDNDRWEPLVAALQRRAGAAVLPQQRRADLMRIAKIQADHLDAIGDAIETWLSVRTEFGNDPTTIAALDALMAQAMRWSELDEIVEDAATRGRDQIADLLARLGDIRRSELDAPEGATLAYERALGVNPAHPGARAGLHTMLDHDAHGRSAVEALVRAHRVTGEAVELLDLVEHRLRTARDPRESIAILKETADLREASGDLSGAQSDIARAFGLDPEDAGLEHDLMRLAAAAEAWLPAADALRLAADNARSEARKAQLRREEAEVRERRLDDAGGAVAALRAAARIAPRDLELQRAIIRVSAKARSWDDAAMAVVAICSLRQLIDEGAIAAIAEAAEATDGWRPIAEAMIEALETAMMPPDLVRELEMMIGRWYRDHVGDLDAAEAAAKRAVEADPDHGETLLLLAELQRRHPGPELAETLVRLDALSDRDIDALREASTIAFDSGMDAARGRDIVASLYRKAARLFVRQETVTGEHQPEPAVMWALEQLVRVDCETDQRMRAIQVLLGATQLPLAHAHILDLQVRAARLCVEEGDRARAIDLYRRVLEERHDDLTLVMELAALCDEETRLIELISTRSRELDLTEDPERKVELRLDLSRLVGKLERRGGRVDALRANLEERPGHRPSIDAIVDVMQDKGQHAELAELLADQAARVHEAGDAVRCAELWRMVGKLHEERLADVPGAIEALSRVIDLDADPDTLDTLARLWLQRAEPRRAAAVLEQRLKMADEATRVPVLLRLARARLQAEQEPAAIEALEEAFAEAPRSGEVRKLLLRLYRQYERWEPLAAALSKAATVVGDAETILAYAREAAEIYNERLDRPEAAVPVLERAHGLAPDDRQLRARLAEGLRVAERLDEARDLLTSLIEDYGRRRSKDRAAAHLQLAKVVHALGDTAEAIAQLELASNMDSGNPIILYTLAELAREGEQLEKAERAYRALLLQVRRGPAVLGASTSIGSAEVLLELSRIAAQRGQADQAEELMESALEVLAEDDEQAPRLQALARQRDDLEFLDRILETRLRSVDSKRRRAEILAERATLREEREQTGDALDDRLEALRLDPSSPEHHERARDLSERLGRRDEYVDAVETLLSKTRRNSDVLERCELLLRLAEALETRQEHDRAIDLLRQAEQTGVREVDVWRAQARVYGSMGDTDRQVEFLQRLADLGEDGSETRVDALYRMAEVQLASPDTVERGVSTMTEALDSAPRFERAARILRRAVDANPGQADLLALYEHVARKVEDRETLLHALEQRAAIPETPPEDVKEGVDLALTLEAFDRAEDLMLRAVDLAGSLLDGQGRATWALMALAQRRADAGDLAGSVKWLCEAVELADLEEVFALGSRIAEATEAEGGDVTLAIKLYEALLERDPSSRQAWEPLARLYRNLGDIDALHRLVDETLDSLQDTGERNALRLQLAHALLPLPDRQSDAAEILRNIVLEEPSHTEAHEALVEVLERTGNDEDLVNLVREQLMRAQARKDTEAVISFSVRLARRQADDPVEAMATLRSALEWAPTHPELLRAIIDRLEGEDERSERAELLERLVEVAAEEQAAPLAIELADLHALLGDEEGELRALVLGYRRDPSNEALRGRLEQTYQARGDYRGLADMLTSAAEAEVNPTRKVAMMRQAATIQRDLLSDPEVAADILRAAYEIAPTDSDLGLELASGLATAGRFGEAGELIEGLLAFAEDEGARLQLLATRADLRSNTGDVDGAVEDLEAALELDPVMIPGRLMAALQAKRSRAAESADATRERSALLRLVQIAMMQDERDTAREALTEWTERERKDAEAIRMLRDLDAAEQNWEAVIKACARLVAIEVDEAQVDAALQLARAAHQLGRPEEAKPGLEHARRKQPDNPEIRAALRDIYEAIGADRELAKLLVQDADDTDNAEIKLELLRRAADLYVELGDTEAALPLIKSVLEISPGDGRATVTLADAYLVSGMLDEADGVLDEALAEARGRRTPEAGMLYHRKAAVAGSRGDHEAQIAHLQQGFACDKNNGHVAAELADLAEALEQWDLAVRVLRTITLLEGPCPITRADAFLRQARISYRRGDRQRAVLWARKAKHEDPDTPDVDAFLAELGEA